MKKFFKIKMANEAAKLVEQDALLVWAFDYGAKLRKYQPWAVSCEIPDVHLDWLVSLRFHAIAWICYYSDY